MPLDPAEYLWRSCFNAHWPNKTLLSVTIELLRHYYATLPKKFETEEEEIVQIHAELQIRRLKPADCTLDAVRFHFENFNFPAFTHFIYKMSKYETEELQDPSTNEPEHPMYDGVHISVQAVLAGELLDKDIPDQPMNMSGLTTTLREILNIARIHHFTSVYGRSPNLRQKSAEGRRTWHGYKEAKEFDDRVFQYIHASAQ